MKIGYLNSILQRISIKKACQGYYLRWYYNGWHYWFFLPGKILRVTEGENYRTIGTRKISMGSGQITYEQINALRTIRNSREIQLLTTIGWLNIRLEPGSVIVANNYINGYEFDFIAIIGSREGYYSPVTDVPDNPSNPSKYIYGFVGIYITHHAVTFTMILTGTGDITVYWGDGTNNTYTLTDIPLVITHTYTDGVTEHTIGIDGEENIIILDASGNHITEIIIPPTATSLTTLILADNDLTDTPYIPPTVPLIYLVLTGNPLTICEVVIGIQIWMCKNYDSDFPGSKVYDDIEANRLVYGGLYSWNQINNPGFCPLFWHVPTTSEWNTLIASCGGDANAGGMLKEVGLVHWNAPNTGAVDNYGFAARGAGYYVSFFGYWSILNNATWFWTSTPHLLYEVAYTKRMAYNSAETVEVILDKQDFSCVRLLKNFLYTVPPFGVLTDYDGNVYVYVTIGTQQWIIQNLRTTHYADGTAIPNLTLDVDWIAEDGTPGHDGAYCAYNNDVLNIPDYGLLYNWYAVNNAHGLAYFKRNGVFEAGWRIPSDADFNTLVVFLGGDLVAGGKLKEQGLAHWNNPNVGATNDYNFTAVGTGQRLNNGVFNGITFINYLYSSTETVGEGGIFLLDSASIFSQLLTQPEGCGESIRCMRDVP